jgi:hypothetical protein
VKTLGLAILVLWLSTAAAASDDPLTAQPVSTADYHTQARAAVEQVLAAPEFGGVSQRDGWGQRFIHWLSDVFHSIACALQGVPEWAVWLLVIWLLLALLAILAHLLYTLWNLATMRGPRGTSAAKAAADRFALLGIAELDFDSLYARAGEHAAAQRWPDAVKYLYVAVILWLDHAGLVAFRRVKTNRDLWRELARHPRCQLEFDHLTRWFEATAYGGRTADETQWNNMTAALEALRQTDALAND